MMIEKIVIIGGGQASLSCASQLRSLGFKGDICMICEESYYPYQRPPLSKKFLTGQFLEERLLLKKVDYYKTNNIQVLLSKKATKIDRDKNISGNIIFKLLIIFNLNEVLFRNY